ncbi:MAG: ATP-binding protein [Verrucomicrobiota bacterium]
MSKLQQNLKIIRPAIVISLGCLLVLGYFISLYVQTSEEAWEKDERTRLARVLNNTRSNLESELFTRIYYTRSISAYVSLHPNLMLEEFYNLAGELVNDDIVINSMSIAPDGVIKAVYPQTGHEQVIGLDLFDHPKRRSIVEKTIQTQKTFVAGPVELIEGGIAFISYTPIFDKTVAEPTFWGMTDIVIRKDELFEAAGFSETGSGAVFALKGYDGEGLRGETFFGDPGIFEQNPVTAVVRLPDGAWIIGAVPASGWVGYLDQDSFLLSVLIVAGITISILIGLFAATILHLRANARQLQSIFNAMTSSVLEIDSKGIITWIGPTQCRLPHAIKCLNVGDSIYSLELGSGNDDARQALEKVIGQQEFHRIELKIGGPQEDAWAMANISPKGPDAATAVLYDITKLKLQQKQLEESQRELSELNSNKDLLFSIIAHDLRSQAAASISLSETLLDKHMELSPEEQGEMLALIYQSGKENIFLLENLLTWARAQQTGLSADRQDVELSNAASRVSKTFRELAIIKNVSIHIDIPLIAVFFDPSMLETVIRNLVSNSLKFTEPGGTIRIEASASAREKGKVELRVTDSGVGMDPERLNTLNNKLLVQTTRGTEQESGTGLGLKLCWDFLNRNEGSMVIESELGKGTSVICSIPAGKNSEN